MNNLYSHAWLKEIKYVLFYFLYYPYYFYFIPLKISKQRMNEYWGVDIWFIFILFLEI